MLYDVYNGIEDNVEIPEITPPTPPAPPVLPTVPFPGTLLRNGSRGNDVRLMQHYLNVISTVHTSIPRLAEDGIFGPITERATREFQRIFRLAIDGIIGPITWNAIVAEHNRIKSQ